MWRRIAVGGVAFSAAALGAWASASPSPSHFWPPTFPRIREPQLGVAQCRGRNKEKAAGKDLFPASMPDRSNAINKHILGNLESNEIVPVRRGLVESVHAAQYAANPRIEDTYFVRTRMAADGGILLGVFDGHSGGAASAFCRDELGGWFPSFVAPYVYVTRLACDKLRCFWNVCILSTGYLEYYKINGYTDDLVAKQPFLDADEHFLTFSYLDGRVRHRSRFAHRFCFQVVALFK